MNKKNLNCHVEPKRQLRAETSQPLHISTRDVAENAKLNHEIAEELKKQSSMSCQCPTLASRSNKDSLATWMPVSSTGMTIRLGSLDTKLKLRLSMTIHFLRPT